MMIGENLHRHVILDLIEDPEGWKYWIDHIKRY